MTVFACSANSMLEDCCSFVFSSRNFVNIFSNSAFSSNNLMNMYIPVGSSALETAFQLAITVNFCLAVSGSRGSVAAGGGGGGEPSFPA